jgi:hypothetical protein
MSSENGTAALSPAVARLEHDPRFIAWTLAAYRNRFKLTEQHLAKELVCDIGSLTRLGLCQIPRVTGDAVQFQLDAQAIALYVGCDWRQLVRILRAVAVMSTLERFPVPGDAALLKVARKRQPSRRTTKRRGK